MVQISPNASYASRFYAVWYCHVRVLTDPLQRTSPWLVALQPDRSHGILVYFQPEQAQVVGLATVGPRAPVQTIMLEESGTPQSGWSTVASVLSQAGPHAGRSAVTIIGYKCIAETRFRTSIHRRVMVDEARDVERLHHDVLTAHPRAVEGELDGAAGGDRAPALAIQTPRNLTWSPGGLSIGS